MKKIRKHLALLFFYGVSFFIILELCALLHYSYTRGGLFYTSRPAVDPGDENSRPEITRQRIHPYFGIMLEPDDRTKDRAIINNYGFISGFDYPLVKESEKQYIIAMFGGSASDLFVRHGLRRVRQNLAHSDLLDDRQIVLLNFSRGGYKQPQQLQLLTYFLSIGQQFDLIINMDGFNEVVFSCLNEINGIEAAMPSYIHISKLIELTDRESLSLEQLELIHDTTSLRDRLNRVTNRMNSTRLASSFVLLELYRNRLSRKYSSALNSFNSQKNQGGTSSLVHLNAAGGKLTESDILAKAIDIWAQSSRLMAAVCRAFDIEYLQIVQPNQYYSSKNFTEFELDNTIDAQSDYCRYVTLGYPLLESKIADLGSAGVSVYSAIGVFDDVGDSIYTDDCCHFNRTGNLILAEFISDILIRDILARSPRQ